MLERVGDKTRWLFVAEERSSKLRVSEIRDDFNVEIPGIGLLFGIEGFRAGFLRLFRDRCIEGCFGGNGVIGFGIFVFSLHRTECALGIVNVPRSFIR